MEISKYDYLAMDPKFRCLRDPSDGVSLDRVFGLVRRMRANGMARKRNIPKQDLDFLMKNNFVHEYKTHSGKNRITLSDCGCELIKAFDRIEDEAPPF